MRPLIATPCRIARQGMAAVSGAFVTFRNVDVHLLTKMREPVTKN